VDDVEYRDAFSDWQNVTVDDALARRFENDYETVYYNLHVHHETANKSRAYRRVNRWPTGLTDRCSTAYRSATLCNSNQPVQTYRALTLSNDSMRFDGDSVIQNRAATAERNPELSRPIAFISPGLSHDYSYDIGFSQ